MSTQYTRDQARITVTVKGIEYDGWLQSEVDRGIEAIAGTFSIPVSLVPGDPPAIARQDEVQVKIGDQVVITGYVISAEPFYRRGECGMRVMGRDRTGDLVRCSAIYKGGQWLKAGLDRIAKDLVTPFGLQVVSDTDLGAPIADFKVYHGETVVEAISRAAKLRGVMVCPDTKGRLLLTRAGVQKFKGAIMRGQNVISMESIGSDEERHSQYFAYGQSNTTADFEMARTLKATSSDAEMKRYLPLIINADGNRTQQELQTLVDHTARVRRGHSMGFRYQVEGWTFEGEPWPLNQRVPIYDDVAGIDGEDWLIAHVRHTCDLKEGDVTELTMRPIEAYDTAPLKTRVHRANWGNRGNTTTHPRGPSDRARGG